MTIYRVDLDAVESLIYRSGACSLNDKDALAMVNELRMLRGMEHAHAALIRTISRVATLNPDAGRIGPGMLAQLVDEARKALAGVGVIYE